MMHVLVVGLLVTLLFCGLALDIGMMEMQKTQMQTAADAAAIAEEMNFERETSSIDNSDGTFAMAAAAAYGYTNGTNNTSVTYLNSLYGAPTVGDYKGHHDIVQVTISRQIKTSFMPLLNKGQVTVAATAIASPPPCDYFLGTKNLVIPTVTLSAIGINQIYAKCPAYIGGGLAVPIGQWWQHFQTYLTGSPAGSLLLGRVKEGTTFNTAPRKDPLASIQQPSVGKCNFQNYSTSTTVTLNPGVYCGSVRNGVVTPGMTIIRGTVTLNPGLYIITGGAYWQYSNITGNGVTLFFTNIAGTLQYGTIVSGVGGYHNFTLNAVKGGALGSTAANGALAGIVVFLDRNWVNTMPQDVVAVSSFHTQGVWYMPSTGLSLQVGSGYCTGYGAIIADNLYLTNFVLHQSGTDYTLYQGPNPLRADSVLVQ